MWLILRVTSSASRTSAPFKGKYPKGVGVERITMTTFFIGFIAGFLAFGFLICREYKGF